MGALALYYVSVQLYVSATFSPGRNPGILSVGGWAGLRAGLDGFGEEIIAFLSGIRPRTVQPVGICITVNDLVNL